ncbi:MAG TPA: EthD domain-containing protein [Ilumatobacteraceae bacterium]
MVRIVYCLRRKPGMSVDEFQRYWREVHAPLVAERAALLGVKKYQQVHTVLPEVNALLQARNGGSPEPFDGVAELWFENLDALGSQDPAVQQASADLLEDERKFIDLEASPIWIADEHVIVG